MGHACLHPYAYRTHHRYANGRQEESSLHQSPQRAGLGYWGGPLGYQCSPYAGFRFGLHHLDSYAGACNLFWHPGVQRQNGHHPGDHRLREKSRLGVAKNGLL